tara:strand:+ start:17294 stop:17605 length:312 start_codon:yes stop_codon:yes gene_type:complete
MFKISFFVPLEYAEVVKKAVFKEGAGKMEAYADCSWETLGTGQFRPLEGSDPFIGSSNKLERVQELKVEMICVETVIRKVIEALKQSHPYEEPAYEVIKIENF